MIIGPAGLGELTLTADNPAATRLFSPRNFVNIGATAAAISCDFGGVYVETEY